MKHLLEISKLVLQTVFRKFKRDTQDLSARNEWWHAYE